VSKEDFGAYRRSRINGKVTVPPRYASVSAEAEGRAADGRDHSCRTLILGLLAGHIPQSSRACLPTIDTTVSVVERAPMPG
jgi:hypothetical protein